VLRREHERFETLCALHAARSSLGSIGSAEPDEIASDDRRLLAALARARRDDAIGRWWAINWPSCSASCSITDSQGAGIVWNRSGGIALSEAMASSIDFL
jgi:hypothetical protein